MPQPADQTDPFDLLRFVVAQEGVYETALQELRAGRKLSHWMWFIFPQLLGLGFSPMSRRYALRSLAEAQAYLEHPVLGPRLKECCRALLTHKDISASAIMGSPDDQKLRSSMTLFDRASTEQSDFALVLARYFRSQPDPRTVELLGN